ncbi:hypothetical protein HMI54_002590 [Coelomomyces lativittatus]|nr:hypothetical protein HMI54_002590 [Coelomomyces lativittatus]KAJ1518051.1 hypothetical protein HMI55_003557 [Coelomomyces lativittatus]
MLPDQQLNGNGHVSESSSNTDVGEIDGLKVSRVNSIDNKKVRTTAIAHHVRGILSNLGEDVEREGLLKTPERYAKALEFFTKGYDDDLNGIFL